MGRSTSRWPAWARARVSVLDERSTVRAPEEIKLRPEGRLNAPAARCGPNRRSGGDERLPRPSRGGGGIGSEVTASHLCAGRRALEVGIDGLRPRDAVGCAADAQRAADAPDDGHRKRGEEEGRRLGLAGADARPHAAGVAGASEQSPEEGADRVDLGDVVQPDLGPTPERRRQERLGGLEHGGQVPLARLCRQRAELRAQRRAPRERGDAHSGSARDEGGADELQAVDLKEHPHARGEGDALVGDEGKHLVVVHHCVEALHPLGVGIAVAHQPSWARVRQGREVPEVASQHAIMSLTGTYAPIKPKRVVALRVEGYQGHGRAARLLHSAPRCLQHRALAEPGGAKQARRVANLEE